MASTQLDRCARDKAGRGEAQYTHRRDRASKDLMKLLSDARITDWRVFGSGQTRTAIVTSDMDVQVRANQTEIGTMKDLIRNLGRNFRIQHTESKNR